MSKPWSLISRNLKQRWEKWSELIINYLRTNTVRAIKHTRLAALVLALSVSGTSGYSAQRFLL